MVDTASKLEERIAERRAEMAALEGKRRKLIEGLVDGEKQRRPALIAERAALNGETLALSEELAELGTRYSTMVLAGYLEREDKAAAALGEARARGTTARQALSAGMDDHRRFLAAGRGLATDDQTRKEAEWVARIALLKAESLIADDATKSAKRAVDEAQEATAAARERLARGNTEAME